MTGDRRSYLVLSIAQSLAQDGARRTGPGMTGVIGLVAAGSGP